MSDHWHHCDEHCAESFRPPGSRQPASEPAVDWKARAEAAAARADAALALIAQRDAACRAEIERLTAALGAAEAAWLDHSNAADALECELAAARAEVERLTRERDEERATLWFAAERTEAARATAAEARRLLEELLDVLSRYRGPYEPLAAAPARYRTLTDAERAARAFLAGEGK